nr:e3 ubiquitin-protein ligase ccnb1ip1 [Quercus suber]
MTCSSPSRPPPLCLQHTSIASATLYLLLLLALAMDFALRCNTLKCRAQLTANAVVTTCSHIFCVACTEASGLASAPSSARVCPACKAPLPARDDAVHASLDPSEEYKKIALGGLSPSVIMECASRGLAFYTYQTAQEIVYQESAARRLREKNHSLGDEMHQLVQQANLEIGGLRDRTAGSSVSMSFSPRWRGACADWKCVDEVLQAEKAELEAKNEELVNAFREKCRKIKELDKLYTTMKQKQDAAMVMKQVEKGARGGVAVVLTVLSALLTCIKISGRFRLRAYAMGCRPRVRRTITYQASKLRADDVTGSAPVSLLPGTPAGHRTRLGQFSTSGVAQVPSNVAQYGTNARQPLRSLDPNVYAGRNVHDGHGISAGMKMGGLHAGGISRAGSTRSPTGFPP